MCGIAGIYYSIKAFPDFSVLQKSKIAISHRGPDDAGEYINSEYGIGFVQTRLSIQDISSQGHQPMISDDGNVVLIFNGEIYNFRELRLELETQGIQFHSQSDTEVLLQLYISQKKKGGDLALMLRRLNGIFAFTVWDAERSSLFVARDALGVKPLYYSDTINGFAFSSEIKALRYLIPLGNDINANAIDRYLSFLWCPGVETPVKSVKKLAPGEAIWVKDGVIVERFTWYRLPVFHSENANYITSSIKPEKSFNKNVVIQNTCYHLRQAVHRQMVSDVPVGAFLSGGLDSSSVVNFAREIKSDIHCFSIELLGLSTEGFVDDLPYARKVAKHLGVNLDVVTVDTKYMAGDLVKMVKQLDEPLADPAPLNVLYICQLAREKGIKVLLSGAGGDDLFTGYRRHMALQSERYWNWLPQSVIYGLERGTSRLDQRWPIGRRLCKLFNGASLTGDERLVNYFRWVDRNDLYALYTPQLKSAIGDIRAEEVMLDFLVDLPPDTNRLERLLALEQRFFLTDHNLTYTDKMSMAVGVEVRVPLLDLDLVEFAAKIPSGMKQRGKEGKWVFKKAMEPFLPHEVIYRSKSGFGAPLRHWMRFDLRDLLGDVLSANNLKTRGLFDPKAVHQLIAANDSGKTDAGYTLLSLLCIEVWCQIFIDNKNI